MAIDINLINTQDVLSFWEDSPHGTIFTHPDVLQAMAEQVDWWIANKGHRPVCLWPVCLNVSNSVTLPEFSYYVGPMWSNTSANMPAHRWLSRSSEVYEGFIRLFIDHYGRFHSCLPKGLIDVRVFDWWNYHQPDKPRFQIRPRYTACIQNLSHKDDAAIHSGFRQLRRRELRKVQKDGPPILTGKWTAEDIINLYESVLGRQDIEIENKNRRTIKSLVDLVKQGFGEVFAYQYSGDTKLAAACLLLYGKNDANMVLNLVDNRHRNTGLPAWMISETIMDARDKGYDCYDFNGANSPNRGDDKHSYGAEPVLYFEITYPGENIG